MDTVTYINKLRAQFLWECPEKDQMRRIIKPYAPDNNDMIKINRSDYSDLDNKIKQIYTEPDGSNILLHLESPEISESYMDNYVANSRVKFKKGSRGRKETPPPNEEKYTENMQGNPIELGTDSVVSVTKSHNESPSTEQKSTKPLQAPQDLNDSGTIKSQEGGITYDSSDSDSSGIKRKSSRKLPFSRIFKGKKDSSDAQKKINKRKTNLQNNNKKHTAFDMKFDYDKDLDDDDDEDDEDEDGDDLKSDFFQLDTELSKSNSQIGNADKDSFFNLETNNNSLVTLHNNGNHNNNTSNNGNNNNNGKKKTHFPQNFIPRNPLLDSGKNNSFKSDRPLKAGNQDGSASSTNNKKTLSRDEYMSDMESLINENDLDKLNLDEVSSNADGSTSSNHLASTDQENNDTISNGEEIVLNEEQDSDSVSSYGRSLLDSDFSTENDLKKQDTSILDNTSVLDDSDIPPDTVPHSIPMTLDEYGIYDGQDDSTIDNAFDNAVKNMKLSAKDSNAKERRPSNHSMNHSVLHRRPSSNSNLGARLRGHTRSSSTASTNSSKTKLASSKQPDVSIGSKLERPNLTSSKSDSKGSSFIIERITNFKKPAHTNSQLSSLFNRRNQTLENPTDALEYFSFVSGSKVPKYDAQNLKVYIQESKKYKNSSFKVNVRKSASIFETIGYILYVYSKELEETNTTNDGVALDWVQNPNKFCLKIVDEDGEPFEDDFGKLDRRKLIKQLSDDEVVLCTVGESELKQNERETPLPYNLDGKMISKGETTKSGEDATHQSGINQFSYYRPILGNDADADKANNAKILDIKVFMYPSTNKLFNYTTISVLVTSSINDILLRYCKMKNLDPNEYLLKIPDKKLAFNLNDTVLRLDGLNEVEIISKKDARKMNIQKSKPDIAKPNLPTIQSSDLTPMTLQPINGYLQPEAYLQPDDMDKTDTIKEVKPQSKLKKLGSKHRLGLTTQISGSSNNSAGVNTSTGLFKNKNSSKSSLHGSLQYYTPNRSVVNVNGSGAGNYQDLFSGAYHKYKVWRRQQMSLMNKHERALALDGDYIYIVPPEKQLHWHENVKTKSIHISQVVLIKKSKRVPEYFKLFFKKGQNEIKRYYFEAVSADECDEIVSRIQNSISAYRMNHKQASH